MPAHRQVFTHRSQHVPKVIAPDCVHCFAPSDCSRVSCPLIRCAPNFESQIPEGECCAECVPTPPPPNPFVDECALSPDPGPCRASLQRFFFNDTAQTCQKFVYGGCLGNDNRFCSLSDCLEACASVTPTEPGELALEFLEVGGLGEHCSFLRSI